MKKLLNTLYITRPECYLHKERETVVIKQGDKKLGQFPMLALQNILCFGQVSVSPGLMAACLETGVGLSFFTEFGKFQAQVMGMPKGNVLLRRTQYRWADDEEKSVSVARLMIAAKVGNCRAVLMREQRNHGASEALAQAAEKMAALLENIRHARNVPQLMGLEGEAASIYFGVFNSLLRSHGFEFSGRVRRPPGDPVNALLSFAYVLLASECASALAGVGLDPYVGFLHQDRPGRKSLALDLMEELRAPLADRFVLTLINRGQMKLDDFVTEASGAVRLKDDARKSFLTAYQERKKESLKHPYLEESIELGLLPHAQALLLARHLRGDMQYYTPFAVR
ncbi:type I-C CRISPR-associated endonuclease Cas1c [Limnohabitans sp.]|uniref:type I-C CRISPR-associated endonuclease Cas1c n=1 Tax=Limnohabitans sp. TaxID=1907725 RepID=UPI0025BAF168|nr:type I-C CRISPR-associated endonuclease Cas1c [Limnohabitans sp.]